MGLFDRLRKNDKKSKKPETSKVQNEENSGEYELDSIFSSVPPKIDDTVKEISENANREYYEENKKIENVVEDINARGEILDTAPGASHLNSVISEQASDFANKMNKEKSDEIRETYLNDHRYAYILNELLTYMWRQETMSKMGVKAQEYSGDAECALALNNYENINEADKIFDWNIIKRVLKNEDLNIKREYIFLPYMESLDRLGSKYNSDRMPKGILEMYEEYKKDDFSTRADKINLGLGMLSELGILYNEKNV